MIKTQIYDNFLEKDEFESMRSNVIKYAQFSITETTENSKSIYFNNLLWKGYQSLDYNCVKSPHFEIVLPLLNKINNIKSLIRVKINCYLKGLEQKKHLDHRDLPFSHYGGLFSLNTCDGGTWIGDKKYDSVENRLVIFDAGQPHASSNTTNSDVRMNINMNWL